MLPFLKNKEGAMAAPIEEPSEDESFDMIDAIADDLMQAVNKRDKGLMRDTIAALCDYIRDMDEEQDTDPL